MESAAYAFLTVFAGLFPIVNPPATSMLFLAMTQHASTADRHDLARRITIYAFLILTASLFFGAYVLAFFGVSLPVLRVAGGLVLAMAGWRLLDAPPDRTQLGVDAAGGGPDVSQMAFYPLTMPLTTGPGTVAVSVALGTRQWDRVGATIVGSMLAIVLMCVLIFVCYWSSDRIRGALSESGADAIGRMFAFILICIGIQIFWAGFAELWSSLPHPAITPQRLR
jgi:multiple antibiotic resistance protein